MALPRSEGLVAHAGSVQHPHADSGVSSRAPTLNRRGSSDAGDFARTTDDKDVTTVNALHVHRAESGLGWGHAEFTNKLRRYFPGREREVGLS